MSIHHGSTYAVPSPFTPMPAFPITLPTGTSGYVTGYTPSSLFVSLSSTQSQVFRTGDGSLHNVAHNLVPLHVASPTLSVPEMRPLVPHPGPATTTIIVHLTGATQRTYEVDCVNPPHPHLYIQVHPEPSCLVAEYTWMNSNWAPITTRSVLRSQPSCDLNRLIGPDSPFPLDVTDYRATTHSLPRF